MPGFYNPNDQRPPGHSSICPGCGHDTLTKREHGVFMCDGCGFESRDLGSLVAHPGAMVCDFCSAPNPTWRYTCVEFEMNRVETLAGIVQQMADPDWAACEACHALIEAGDTEKLSRHCARTFASANGAPSTLVPRIAREMRVLHEKFMRARQGEAEPIGATS